MENNLLSKEAAEQRNFVAAEAMIRYGGSFAACIGRAYMLADSGNKDRLLSAFDDMFAKYARLATGSDE